MPGIRRPGYWMSQRSMRLRQSAGRGSPTAGSSNLGSSTGNRSGFRTGTVFSSDGQSGVVEIGTTLSEDTRRSQGPPCRRTPTRRLFGQQACRSLLFRQKHGCRFLLPWWRSEVRWSRNDSRSSNCPRSLKSLKQRLRNRSRWQLFELETPALTDLDWPALHDVPERTQGEGFMVPSSPFMAQEFGSLEGSNRLPVFDRYTWIEFHREVPPGTSRFCRVETEVVREPKLSHRPRDFLH